MDIELTLCGLAENNLGLLYRQSALAAGISASALDRRLATGRAVRLHAGVYRHAAAAPAPSQALLAALHAAGPGAVVSHRCAAALWGIGAPVDQPELTVPTGRCPRLRGVVVHRTNLLPQHHVSRRAGLAVTSAERTLGDLGAVTTGRAVASSVAQALADERTTVSRLFRLIDEIGRSGRNGIGVLRRVLDDWLLGEQRPDSVLEPMMARLLRAHGVPPGRFHYAISDAEGRFVAEVDFAWPSAGVVAEVDGLSVHRSRSALQRDLARQNRVVALGWTVLRFTWHDVVQRPGDVAAQVTAALARARAA